MPGTRELNAPCLAVRWGSFRARFLSGRYRVYPCTTTRNFPENASYTRTGCARNDARFLSDVLIFARPRVGAGCGFLRFRFADKARNGNTRNPFSSVSARRLLSSWPRFSLSFRIEWLFRRARPGVTFAETRAYVLHTPRRARRTRNGRNRARNSVCFTYR